MSENCIVGIGVHPTGVTLLPTLRGFSDMLRVGTIDTVCISNLCGHGALCPYG